ncbi:D-alanyl-D-alanine carboxypeptidase family protein [Oceanobacillus chungangensis]|uniref:serine-type D-Ala-D-Ala carboxypeptidase n=1 Tax=Oceanobacillus chungangensis TaxID=1229152 RepID=A0A3D8Q3X0_9BACI|nr:D-alanyl-D-alanine carboxypeptidase family protein [Oceanobacillus chungangensis]RDW21995.1 D-alanyl-D-alanine carboxypeptidase [Oceanobacillus chungangensis]
MKKYILIVTMIFSISAIFPSISVLAEEKPADETSEGLNLAPDSKSAILIERDTGKLLFDKNAHEKLPPASMTKIMTLLLIMEALEQGNLKLEETIRVSEHAASMGGSQIFLEAGEEMSVDDLLKGVAIASGNDASVALAERIAGSEEAFVKKMNDKVKELKLENTKFQNTTGLPADDHYSTAYDMAVMAKELLKYETITNYTSIYEDYLRKGKENEFWLVNTNKLVRFYPGVDGLKTGFTSEAMYCLTATAEKDGMRVIAVVMGAKTPKERNSTVSAMLDYAFNSYETNKLFEKNEKIMDLKLLKADKNNIKVVTSESISTLHTKGESVENITSEVVLDKNIRLPINIGDQVGKLIVKNGDKKILESPLTVDENIGKASYFTLLKRSVQAIVKAN